MFSSTDHYIFSFYGCFCLKTPYWVCIFDSLTLNWLLPACNSCLFKAYLTHIFFCKTRHSFLALRNTRQHFRTMLKAILSNEITLQKGTKMRKMWHKIHCQKDICLQLESWNKKAEYCLIWLLLGMCMLDNSFFFFSCSVHVHKWLQKYHKYWFWYNK